MADKQVDISKLTDEQLEILNEAESRGSLIDNHPDLQRQSPEAEQPRVIPTRPFHGQAPAKEDWRTKKEPAPTGYGNPVDDPEWRKTHWPGNEKV